MFAIIIAKVTEGMKEKGRKGKAWEQIHSFYCEQSCADAFCKVETSFLEKFFRYNIADYFKDWLVSLEEQPYNCKITDRQSKTLLAHAFQAKSAFRVAQLNSKIYDFYAKDSTQTTVPFKHLFSNCDSIDQCSIEANQLVFVQTKMRADIEKIQTLPCSILREIEQLQERVQGVESARKELAQYSCKSITLMLVYFGDVNFQLVDKRHYSQRKVKFFGKDKILKIHVFYVSRLAMIDKFKRINRIQTMEYIDDLLIQLYEMKREKRRADLVKQKSMGESKQTKINGRQFVYKTCKWLTVVSITSFTIGALYLRFFY